jgi:hypothetical protein
MAALWLTTIRSLGRPSRTTVSKKESERAGWALCTRPKILDFIVQSL